MKEVRVRKLHESIRWIQEHYKDVATGTYLDYERVVLVNPISDSGAVAIFEKKSTNEQALAIFLWREKDGMFMFWFPSDSDLLFFERIQAYRERVEAYNYLRRTGEEISSEGE